MDSVSLPDDPVSKAVMDNVLGKLPTKKPKVTVRCEVCNLEFSSQTVLDSHIAGSKHQRKAKAAELMKSLQETETGFERDEISGVIRCTVCDVTVNSPQLLATHIAGNKHRQRAAKQAGGDVTTLPQPKRQCSGQDTSFYSGNTGDSAPQVASFTPAAPAATNSSSLEIPECVTKLEETKGGGKYLCNPCQAHCNSEQQLAQHLQSKKHQDKLSGRSPKGRGFFRGRRRQFRGARFATGGRGVPRTHTYTQPLSSNFVAGGALL